MTTILPQVYVLYILKSTTSCPIAVHVQWRGVCGAAEGLQLSCGFAFQRYPLIYSKVGCLQRYSLQRYSLQRYSLQRYSLQRYSLQRYSLRRYSLRRYSLRRYSLRRYSLRRYSLRRYSLRRYSLRRYSLRRYSLRRYSLPWGGSGSEGKGWVSLT